MKFLILVKAYCWLSYVLFAQAAPQKKCESIEIDGIYHEKEILKKDLDRPYQLIVDWKTNILFFSYSIGQNQEDHFKSAYIDLNNNNFINIDGIQDGFASTVDQEKGTVYLGGSEGIYTFDYKTKTATHYKAKDHNIWLLFFKEHLYFIDYPKQNVYEYEGNEPTLLKHFSKDEITQFAIDKKGETFFVNNTGLFGVEKGLSLDKVKLYDSRLAFRGISLDKNGEAYFCGENGIFKLFLDKSDNVTRFKHVVHINNAFGLTFDKDNNIIYANSNEIVRLKPSKNKCST